MLPLRRLKYFLAKNPDEPPGVDLTPDPPKVSEQDYGLIVELNPILGVTSYKPAFLQ